MEIGTYSKNDLTAFTIILCKEFHQCITKFWKRGEEKYVLYRSRGRGSQSGICRGGVVFGRGAAGGKRLI